MQPIRFATYVPHGEGKTSPCRDGSNEKSALFVSPRPGRQVNPAPIPGVLSRTPHPQPLPPIHRPSEIPQRVTDPYDARAMGPIDCHYSTWDPPPRAHPRVFPDPYGGRPPQAYYQEPYESYPPAPRRYQDSSWRAGGRKREPPPLPIERLPRHRVSHDRPEDSQREANEQRVRRQLQDVHALEDLCQKDALYTRYQKLSGKGTGHQTRDRVDETDAGDKNLGDPSEESWELNDFYWKENTELTEDKSEILSVLETELSELRRGQLVPNCVWTSNAKIYVVAEQANVLRLYFEPSQAS